MQELFFKTGMLDVGATFERSLASAKQYNLPHEVGSGWEPEGNQSYVSGRGWAPGRNIRVASLY